MSKRLVILVPSDRESEDPKYWENFVWRVKYALKHEKIDADVREAGPK